MDVRIYRPTKTAMQSGRAKTDHWVLEFETGEARETDALMGWTGSRDTRRQLQLRFESKDDAIAYARRHGFNYSIDEPEERVFRPKSYAENFTRRG